MKTMMDKLDNFILDKIIEVEKTKIDSTRNITNQYWQFIDKKEKLEYCQELIEEFKNFIS